MNYLMLTNSVDIETERINRLKVVKHPKQKYRLTEAAKEWKKLNMNI